MENIILTGDRPTGRLHLGHLVGSLSQRVQLQNSGKFDQIFIEIADAQATTDNSGNIQKVKDLYLNFVQRNDIRLNDAISVEMLKYISSIIIVIGNTFADWKIFYFTTEMIT